MSNKNDDDIKIFKMSDRSFEFSEAQRIVDEVERQRLNQNLSKARLLGAYLANEVKNLGTGSVFDEIIKKANDENDLNEVKQRKVLLAFAIESCVAVYSPNKFVGASAINTYYETIMENAKSFYDNISSTGAFSFYYLDLRSGVKVCRAIGKTFAKLCFHENEAVYEELGYSLNNAFYEIIRGIIDGMDFQ